MTAGSEGVMREDAMSKASRERWMETRGGQQLPFTNGATGHGPGAHGRSPTFREWLEGQFARAEASGLPHTEFVHVGPLEAEVLLGFSKGNRNESDGVIAAYGRDAMNDAWVTTHQGFAFDVQRRMFDGHHRLRMVRTTGETIYVAITFGLPVEAVKVTDVGKGRTVANALQLEHRMVDAKRVVSWMSTALKLERGSIHSHLKFSVREVEDALVRHQEALAAVDGVRGKKCPAPFWGSIIYAFPIEREAVVAFAAAVVNGTNLDRDDPAFALREYLHSMRKGRHTAGQANSDAVLLHTLIGLRAHLEGRRITKVQVRDPKAIVAWFRERVERARR